MCPRNAAIRSLAVDGRPFFVYGAAFFYERIPRERWRATLEAYKNLGINTIDLYLIWNWHEPSEGVADFTGATDPRRDLLGLLKLTHELGFKLILRPGTRDQFLSSTGSVGIAKIVGEGAKRTGQQSRERRVCG